MHKSSINIGSLVQYIDIDYNIIHGVITKQFDNHREISDKGKAVEVLWFDDGVPTIESVRAMRDPELDYMEIVSEGQ